MKFFINAVGITHIVLYKLSQVNKALIVHGYKAYSRFPFTHS